MPKRLQKKPNFRRGKRRPARKYNRGVLTRFDRYTFSRINVPFPDQLFTKLTYAESGRITAGGVGALGVHTWRHNDITDPNYSGTGHQVFYNDQLAGIYNQYCVYGCKIKLTVCPTQAQDGPVKVFLRCRKSATLPTDPELEEERLYSKYKMLSSGLGSNGDPKTLTMYVPVNKLFGKTKPQVLADDQFSAATSTSTTSSPALKSYYTACVYAMDPSKTGDVWYNVHLTYYVKFSERVPQGKS